MAEFEKRKKAYTIFKVSGVDQLTIQRTEQRVYIFYGLTWTEVSESRLLLAYMGMPKLCANGAQRLHHEILKNVFIITQKRR
jgi:hypothetical protein